MGALHAGHLSLVERARRENDHVAACVFVNPTQFGPARGPLALPARPRARSRAPRRAPACDLLFAPLPERDVPAGFVDLRSTMGGPALGLEGERRPGHFRGVATVVLKLLNLFAPERAYFGAEGRAAARGDPAHGPRPRRARRDRRLPHRARARRPGPEQPQRVPGPRGAAGGGACSIAPCAPPRRLWARGERDAAGPAPGHSTRSSAAEPLARAGLRDRGRPRDLRRARAGRATRPWPSSPCSSARPG